MTLDLTNMVSQTIDVYENDEDLFRKTDEIMTSYIQMFMPNEFIKFHGSLVCGRPAFRLIRNKDGSCSIVKK